MLKHYTQVQREEWPCRWFSPQEIACRGSGMVLLTDASRDALLRLDALREAMGHPLIVTSGYRSPAHNKAVGGASRSKHMEGIAFDVSMANVDPHRFETEAKRAGFRGIGLYPPQKAQGARNFIHIDTRPAPGWRGAQWGEFPARVNRFSAEEPARPVARAAKDGGVAAAVGTAVVAVAGEAEPVLRQTAPFLPEHWQGYAFALVAALALILAVWRALQRQDA